MDSNTNDIEHFLMQSIEYSMQLICKVKNCFSRCAISWSLLFGQNVSNLANCTELKNIRKYKKLFYQKKPVVFLEHSWCQQLETPSQSLHIWHCASRIKHSNCLKNFLVSFSHSSTPSNWSWRFACCRQQFRQRAKQTPAGSSQSDFARAKSPRDRQCARGAWECVCLFAFRPRQPKSKASSRVRERKRAGSN